MGDIDTTVSLDELRESLGIGREEAAAAIAALIDPASAPPAEATVEGDGTGEALPPIEAGTVTEPVEAPAVEPSAVQRIAAEVADAVEETAGAASVTINVFDTTRTFTTNEEAFAAAVDTDEDSAEEAEVDDAEESGDDRVEIDPQNPGRFRAILVREGERTADDRIVEVGATEWRPTPLPLMLQTRTDIGHMGAEIAGVIETIERDGNDIIGEGRFDESPTGIEAARLAANKVMRGISVDPGDVEFDVEIEEMDEDGFPTKVLARFTHMTILGATQTPFQAIGSSQVEWLAPRIEEEAALAASAEFTATRFHDLSLTDRDRGWSSSDAKARVREWASSDGSGDVEKIDFGKFRQAFFWYDPADPEALGSYKLPFADVVNGQLQAVWRGVTAAAGAVQGARGGVSIPSSDRSAVQSHIGRYYAKAREKFDDDSIKPPWEMSANEVIEMATALTAAAPRTFPVSWFKTPEFSGPVPLTVEPVRGDDGKELGCRVYGHLALWGQCHTGYQGVCQMAPRSEHDYAYFLTGAVHLDDGTQTRVGPITFGTEHSDLHMNPYAAKAHYDDTGRVAAWVTIGEDDHGIWCTGALRPDLDPDQAASFAAAAPSGDWRWLGGSLELIAVLAVNTPGFPIARFEDDHQVALVASGYAPQRDRGRHVLGKEIDGLRLTTQEMLNRVLEGISELKTTITTQSGRLDAIDLVVKPIADARTEERLAAVRERLGI